MSEIVTVVLGLAKNVFQVHGAGRAVLRKKLRRAHVLEFFGQLLLWKLAAVLTSGRARSASWARAFG